MPSQRSGCPSPTGPSHEPGKIVGSLSLQSSPSTMTVPSSARQAAAACPSPSRSLALKRQLPLSHFATAHPAGMTGGSAVAQSASTLQPRASSAASGSFELASEPSDLASLADASPASGLAPPLPPGGGAVDDPPQETVHVMERRRTSLRRVLGVSCISPRESSKPCTSDSSPSKPALEPSMAAKAMRATQQPMRPDHHPKASQRVPSTL